LPLLRRLAGPTAKPARFMLRIVFRHHPFL